MTLVDPTGGIRELSETSTGTDADLWWALRGAGANNFGVVTDLTFALEDAPAQSVNWKTTFATNEECAKVLDTITALGVRDATSSSALPEKLGLQLLGYGVGTGNPGACTLSGQFLGPMSDFRHAESILAAELKTRNVVVTEQFNATEFPSWVETLTGLMGNLTGPTVRIAKYSQSLLDDGDPQYSQSGGASSIFHAVQKTVGVADTVTSISFDLNGPVARTNIEQPHGSSAFAAGGNRHALFLNQINTVNYPGFNDTAAQERVNAVVDNLTATVKRNDVQGTWGAYVNYIDPRLQNWAEAYYGAGLGRLKLLKQQIDPWTVFDYPQGLARA
jgi:hypothetical protein